MTPDEIRCAQAELGLSEAQFSRVVGVDERTVRRWKSGSRAVSEPAVRLIRAYLAGYRPADMPWPQG